MTKEFRALVDNTGKYCEGMLEEAFRLGLNAGLANKFTEGTFEWAMQQMRQGGTVKRRKSFAFAMWMHGSQVFSPGARGIDLEHISATDWEIVPEPKPEPEGHDFAWAAQRIACGKRVRRKTWDTGWYLGDNKTTVSVNDTLKTDWVLAPKGESR